MKSTLPVCVVRVAALLLLQVALGGGARAGAATLTVTTGGPNTGAVGISPVGVVCNPIPNGTCVFTIPDGTTLKLAANSPATPGIFMGGTGSAAACATSICTFTLTADSSIMAIFDPALGPFPTITITLAGAPGEVGADNNRCQNIDPMQFSACTTFYGAGSVATLQARPPAGTTFVGFSDGTANAAGCGASPCVFTLMTSSAVTATFRRSVTLAVPIDIKPGSLPNSINTLARGKIPVAILGTATFDAPAIVDRASLTFGRSGDEQSLAFCNDSAEDVNQDGFADLVCHFETRSTDFQPGDTQGFLKGSTLAGGALGGSDSVRIVR